MMATELSFAHEDGLSGPDRAQTIERWHLQVSGIVQGVGFRPFVHNLAAGLGLSGWVRNTNGGVEMELQGMVIALERFIDQLRHNGPPLAQILAVAIEHVPCVSLRRSIVEQAAGLAILDSLDASGEPAGRRRRTLISPDIATCRACLAELADPADRRYRYAFTNCTHCGPRYTIMSSLPYDRPRTTMADFILCPDCTHEYSNPADRRFHAQPVACPTCGPHLTLRPSWRPREIEAGDRDASAPSLPGDSGHSDEEVIALAAIVLKEGGIVAIKGLGGFHLACRADDPLAVGRLRQAKGRPHKALALMVSDIAMARRLPCRISLAEEAVLLSKEAPIVLLEKDPRGAEELSAVAPDNGSVGVMLPYSPLHHLLLKAAGMPLVMTSGNRRGEPLCIDDTEAEAQLDGIYDYLLLHDRPIAHRCDDSVVFVAQWAGQVGLERGRVSESHMTQQVRRSRGFAPLPILLPEALALDTPLLAAGGDLKNVGAVADGRMVFLTPHIGELVSPHVRADQARSIADFERLFHIRPAAVVCDAHPDYASSRYARQRAAGEGLPLIEVQHHHAHIAGCLAENDHAAPAIGLSFDGTGYGRDGCIWGGEVLRVHPAGFERLYHLEYLPLPGGEAAIHRPYRLAIAYVRTLLPDLDINMLLPEIPPREVAIIDRLIARRLNTPLTSSMGRLFDAISALLGLCYTASHEAHAAIALENAALLSDAEGRYDFYLDEDRIHLTPLMAGIILERQRGESVPNIARRFHRTIAEIALATAAAARAQHGIDHVALSGGVWQNRLLLGMTVPLLAGADFHVLLHRQIPANDGGLAYGQVAVAATQLALER